MEGDQPFEGTAKSERKKIELLFQIEKMGSQPPNLRTKTLMFLSSLSTRARSAGPRARGGLFTDLTIYLYGGTSADLSKIPQFLRGIVVCFCRKNNQCKKVGD